MIRVQNPINPVNTAGIYFYAAQNQNSAGQAVDIAMQTTATGSSSGTERLRITSSGTVGIATTTPAARLDVNGTLKAGTGGTIITNM